MANNCESYYVVFLSAILSLGIPISLALLSFLIFKRRHPASHPMSEASKFASHRSVLGERINIRFFLASNAALILIALALELIPCVITLHSENREGLLKGLVAIITIAGVALLGLLYAVRKGDMGWLSAQQASGGEST